MPTTDILAISTLNLDLANFRTVPQRDEIQSVHAMIAIKPDWFWALMESLIEDGYHPTENIIILKSGPRGAFRIVKEGNRRIAAMKLIYGIISDSSIELPSHIISAISELPNSWFRENAKVPCAVYEKKESDLVAKIVSLTHGKGEKAGRDRWTAVARARHNRDESGSQEPGLDFLEKFLKVGRNINALQAQRWGGDYPLTVLDETLKKVAPRFTFTTARELSDKYPAIKYRAKLEDIARDIWSRDHRFF